MPHFSTYLKNQHQLRQLIPSSLFSNQRNHSLLSYFGQMLVPLTIFIFFMLVFYLSFHNNLASFVLIIMNQQYILSTQGQYCHSIIYFFIFQNKMLSDSFQPKTPMKRTNNNKQELDYKQLTNSREEADPFSFRANENEKNHQYLSKIEEEQKGNPKSRQQYTQKKINIVSGLPSQKTEKKKYLTLMSTFQSLKKQKKVLEEEDDLSNIANEQYNETLDRKDEELRASLNYFNEEFLLISHRILQGNKESNRSMIQIQNQEKIAIISQMNSQKKIEQEYSDESQVEKDQKNPSHKIKKKITLCRIKKAQQKQQDILQIKQVYRYCIGCQYPILEANIKIHQEKCIEYQKIYELSYEQIAQFLKKMISQLGRRIEHIKQTLTEEDLKNLKICTDALIQESQLISATGQQNQIYNFKFQSLKEVNKKWISFAEEICKLNWFIKLRQVVKEKHLK